MSTTTYTPPASPRGHVSDHEYETILDDWFADTPRDLVWPLNIQTYAAMRRDASVAAILSGYTLQLRRASWQFDGRDIDPAHVRLLSDDMDIPVAGDTPHGAARTRGVSWSEHLRVALDSSLTFGHMGFALGADVTGGQARLNVLAERPPQTITEIHADPISGAFLGITQDDRRRDGTPQIAARDMVWYCHERSAGANWAGNSLFKAAWLAWTIKREMIRVHATSNRRWGAGVPVMEANPGSDPTPEQMREAMQMAAAARSGEQAGAASPPNFTMRIMGLSGSVPDTLAFIAWLDRQVTRSCLMQHLELAQGASGGGRALGEAFIGSWTLSLESLGEAVASEATRQVAARVVEWNWGADAPVPRIVVSGIGSRREVTAASLQQLLSSGALSADPALEAWIRREYRLPERDGMAQPAPSVAGDTIAAANRKPRARSPKAKESHPAQLLLPLNAASGVEQLQTDWEAARADLLEQWPDASADLVDDLATKAADAVAQDRTGDLGDLAATAVVVAGISTLIGAGMTGLAALAAASAVAELAAAGMDTEAPDSPGADRIDDLADAQAGILAGGYAAAAGRKALTMAGPEVDRDEVEAAVVAHLAEMSATAAGLAADTFGAALSSAQMVARRDVFAAFPDATFVAEEKNDGPSQCAPCKAINGTEFNGLDEADAAYRSGSYVGCLGGSRCHGTYTIKR